MDHHRRGRREITVAEPIEVPVEDAIDDFELRIRGLSPQSQQTLRLRFVEDLEYEAIATRLDTDEQRVLAQAVELMKRLVQS